MYILKRIFTMKQQKPYKIQDGERKLGRFGVTAMNLKDLRRKSAEKLCIPMNEKIKVVLEEDGTEVENESYFTTLPEHTAFVILRPGQCWYGYISYLKLATKKILENITPDTGMKNTLKSVLSDPECPELVAIIEYVKNLNLNIRAESIDEDPQWFEGVPGNLKTKEAVLKKSAKERVRSYFYSSKDSIDKSKIDSETKRKLSATLNRFKDDLKEVCFYEDYFARSSVTGRKFCDDDGWFTCEGPFNEEICRGLHRINPYGSRDSRILFKTWNLDHQIEKSREVLPNLVIAAEECPEDKEINSSYFYDLLFTRANLKLVDVRCHIIASHENCNVDLKRIYRKRKL